MLLIALTALHVSNCTKVCDMDDEVLAESLYLVNNGFSTRCESCERKLHYPGNRTQDPLLSGDVQKDVLFPILQKNVQLALLIRKIKKHTSAGLFLGHLPYVYCIIWRWRAGRALRNIWRARSA